MIFPLQSSLLLLSQEKTSSHFQAHAAHRLLRKQDKGHGTLYLFGHLSEVADEAQDGAPDQGVTDAAEVRFVTIEVGVEGINSLHCG